MEFFGQKWPDLGMYLIAGVLQLSMYPRLERWMYLNIGVLQLSMYPHLERGMYLIAGVLDLSRGVKGIIIWLCLFYIYFYLYYSWFIYIELSIDADRSLFFGQNFNLKNWFENQIAKSQ